MTPAISAVVNTYNAALHLDAVLDSLANFDEIVVCDMESTDDTVAIARAHGARIVTFPRGDCNICEPARDFAIRSASHPWVLVVDADETVPAALRDYLYRHLATYGPDKAPALMIPRLNRFMGRPATGSPDYQLRFVPRDRTHWPPVIHSHPVIDGPVDKIPAGRGDYTYHLGHLDDATLRQRLDKLNRYTDRDSERRDTRRYSTLALLARPCWFFVRSLLIGGGWRDGRRGIVRAYMDAIYQMMMLGKIEERSAARGSTQSP